MDLFSAISARSSETVQLVRNFLTNGLPDVDDPIYAQRSGVTSDAIDRLNRLIAQFGALKETSDALCGINSSANTNKSLAGTFANCSMTVVTERSPADVFVRWVREDETWKLLHFSVNYADQSLLLDKAEALDALAKEQTDSDE